MFSVFRRGGHFDSDKITPLMRAASHEDPSQLMDLLVSSHARATLFVKDSRGRTALDWARLVNNEMSVIALRKAMLTSINDSRADMVGNAMDVAERLRAANKDATRKLMEALKQRDAMAAMEVHACVCVCVCVCLRTCMAGTPPVALAEPSGSSDVNASGTCVVNPKP